MTSDFEIPPPPKHGNWFIWWAAIWVVGWSAAFVVYLIWGPGL